MFSYLSRLHSRNPRARSDLLQCFSGTFCKVQCSAGVPFTEVPTHPRTVTPVLTGRVTPTKSWRETEGGVSIFVGVGVLGFTGVFPSSWGVFYFEDFIRFPFLLSFFDPDTELEFYYYYCFTSFIIFDL